MRTVNKVILIGNITRDPSIKNTENNKKIALFTIATNRYYKTAEGEQKSESEFTNCITWGSLAERCEQFLTKGKLVYAEGRLKTRIIEKEDGTKTYKTEVVVSNIIFLNKKSDFEDNQIDEADFIEEDKF
ncbi:MAG: single-stranded DNA-binding protein [Candidatus Gracilibacteria bacterium]|nr:single-stranded DNA-binding protein [Candidatus Gracilibacteria bacterium]